MESATVQKVMHVLNYMEQAKQINLDRMAGGAVQEGEDYVEGTTVESLQAQIQLLSREVAKFARKCTSFMTPTQMDSAIQEEFANLQLENTRYIYIYMYIYIYIYIFI